MNNNLCMYVNLFEWITYIIHLSWLYLTIVITDSFNLWGFFVLFVSLNFFVVGVIIIGKYSTL